MSNSTERINGKMHLTRKIKYPQKLPMTTKVVDKISDEGACVKRKTPDKTKETVLASKKLKLESSPEQLEILSVKESKGQVMIEFRSPSCSAPSISGSDSDPHSNQTTQDGFTEIKGKDQKDAESHNYQTVHGAMSTAIKVEDQADTKIEDEMEFSALGYTVRYVPENDDVDQSNQTNQDQFTKIEDEMELCDQVKIDAHKPSKPPEEEKKKSELVCDICWREYSSKGKLALHRMLHGKGKFLCSVCGMAKFTQQELDTHMRIHDIIYACDICPKKYTKHSSLAKHRRLHGFPKLHCTVCGVDNLYEFQLDVHMRTHNSNPIVLACDVCPEGILSVRQGKSNFYCKVCGVPKVTQEVIDTYIKTHNTKPNSIRDICSAKSNLNFHRECHEPNSLKKPSQ